MCERLASLPVSQRCFYLEEGTLHWQDKDLSFWDRWDLWDVEHHLFKVLIVVVAYFMLVRNPAKLSSKRVQSAGHGALCPAAVLQVSDVSCVDSHAESHALGRKTLCRAGFCFDGHNTTMFRLSVAQQQSLERDLASKY